MTMEGALARNAPADPLRHRPDAQSEVGRRYREAVARIAQDVIYKGVSLTQLNQNVTRARMDWAINDLEKEAHSLEALVNLFSGIEAQELADKIFTKAWQAVLLKQPITHKENPISPEKLTREDVAREFAWFDLRADLVAAEEKTIKYYRRFLELNQDRTIPVTDKIQLSSLDVEVLVIDLEVRRAERIADEAERKETLLALNRRLVELIKQLMETREDNGKCLELQEMYLFRRLVYMANTGHLASISHGNPRKDLKRDTASKERSIDMVISLAGQAPLHLQMKTYRADVDAQTRWDQYGRLERSRDHLEGSSTMLTRLETEAVEAAYAASQRVAEDQPTTIMDKQRVFAPLAHNLEPATANMFTVLLGLDPEVCAREMEEFKAKERALNERLMARREKERLIQAALDRHSAEFKAAQQAEADRIARDIEKTALEAAEREARIFEAQRIAAETSRREREAQLARDVEKKKEIDQRLAAMNLTQKRQKAAAKGLITKAENAKLIPEWIPKKVEGLATAANLVRLGFLSSESVKARDMALIDAAKKEFSRVFPKPKDLAQVFQTKEQFDQNPLDDETREVLAELRGR